MDHYNWWGMPMMWFIWLPVIIIAVVLIVRYSNNNQPKEKGDSPMDILRKRYARGEVTKEEFEEKRKNLM